MESLQPRLIAKHKETFLSQLTGSSSRNSAGAESLLGALARSRVQEEPTEQSGWWWCPWVWPGKGPLFPLCGHLSSGEDESPDAAGPFLGPSAGATTAASSFPPPHSRIFAEMSPYCVPGPGGVRVREKLNGVGARAPAGLLRGGGRKRAHSRPPGEAAAGEWAAWVAGVAEAAYAEVPHVSDQAAGPGGRESVTTDEKSFSGRGAWGRVSQSSESPSQGSHSLRWDGRQRLPSSCPLGATPSHAT